MTPKLIAIIAAVVGIIALAFMKYFDVQSQSAHTVNTSDAQHIKATVKIGVDNWAGYYPLCSKHFRSSMRNAGLLSDCDNDNADLDARFTKLRKGELQFAVTSVDAYLALGDDYNFPGAIVTVIDESKGDDALVAYEDTIASMDDLKGNTALRIALTPDSPSEHLTRSLAVHFDVKSLKERGSWMVKADGSEQAVQMLANRRVDGAVLWEPDVTKALQIDGVSKVIGTEDTEKLIVDVLLVNREFMAQNPELVKETLSVYFDTLSFYKQKPNNLVRELAKETGLQSGAVQSMLQGVKWVSLTENAFDWFATVSMPGSNEFLIDAIDSALDVLGETGVTTSNPLPEQNPYAITQSQFVAELFDTKVGNVDPSLLDSQQKIQFTAISDSEWESLREVGTLKVRKIRFSPSDSNLSLDAKRVLDEAAKDIAHYPNYRILVKGHTSLSGDPKQNQLLSQDRAEAVERYLSITHGISEARLHAKGAGSDEPLARLPNESNRAYSYRLPRVELILKAGAM